MVQLEGLKPFMDTVPEVEPAQSSVAQISKELDIGSPVRTTTGVPGNLVGQAIIRGADGVYR